MPGEQAPASFVDRRTLTGPLLARMISDELPARGRADVVTLFGMGGIGKTTVARWLVWRPEVEARYPDGRIWVTLGRQPPERLALLTNLLRQLRPQTLPNLSEDAARDDLATILDSKAVLIVIDDVWPGRSAEAAKALVIPSQTSRYFMTTRSAKLASDLGLTGFAVDEMTDEEAAQFMAGALGHALTADERQNVEQLQATVHGHPLALEVAAGRLTSGMNWGSLLAALAQESRRLEAFEETDDVFADPDGTANQRGVRASLMLSVRELSAKGQSLFAWLGAVDEDAALSARAAGTLWSMDEDAAGRALQSFAGAGLLKRVDGHFRMHDLLRDLAIELLCAPVAPHRADDLPGQGLTEAGAAAALLDRYRARRTGGLWHTLGDDGYIHEHLVNLMQRAGASADIDALLWEESADARCGWYSARELLGQTAGYLADVGQIWAYADRMGASGGRPIAEMIGLQLHCALLISSINSLSRSAAPEVFAAAVRCGIMPLPVAVALVEQGAETKTRASDLMVLARVASATDRPPLLRKAAAYVRDAVLTDTQFDLLAEISELTPPAQRPERISQALAFVRGFGAFPSKVRILLRLSALVDEQQRLALLDEAAMAARSITDLGLRAASLAEVAGQLPLEARPAVLAEARGYADLSESPANKASALAELARHYPLPEREAGLDDALRAARAISKRSDRAHAMLELASQLSDADHQHVLDEVLRDAQSEAVLQFRKTLLLGLVDYFPPEQALELAQKNAFPFVIEDAVPRTVVRLPPAAALIAARRIGDTRRRGWALAVIAGKLPEGEQIGVVREALSSARINDGQSRSLALAQAVAFVPADQGLAFAREVEGIHLGDDTIRAVISRLPLAQGLAIAQEFRKSLRGSDIQQLASNLPELVGPEFEQAWALTTALPFASERLAARTALARRLPASNRANVLQQLVTDAWDLKDEGQALALAKLAELLPTSDQPSFVEAILKSLASSVSKVPETVDKVLEIIATLARRFPTEVALNLSQKMPIAQFRVRVMAEAADRSPSPAREALLQQAFGLATSAYGETERLTAIVEMLGYTSPSEALALARRMWNPEPNMIYGGVPRARDIKDAALASLVPRLTIEEGILAANEITSGRWRARAITARAAKLPVPDRLPLLDEALGIVCRLDRWERPDALAALAVDLPTLLSRDEIYPRWTLAAHNIARDARQACLSDTAALLPLINLLGGEAGVQQLMRSIVRVGVWWP